jgi:hypothetical protein
MATSKADRRSIEVRTIGPRVSATEAVARTKRMTLGRLFRTRVAGLFGRERSPEIYPAYYPDYVAYTSVTLHRYVGGDRDLKFLAGVDAITGRVGEVDVELPDRRVESVDPAAVIEPTLDEHEIAAAWREWLWKYLDRKYRPVKRPESSLDDLELVYIPYWIVDYGSRESSFAVSGLTKQAEHIEDIGPLAAYYDDALS